MWDGYSGGNMDRPALQRLLFDARNKQFDLILVYKQDRLSRRLKDLLGLLEEFDTLGIGYKSATEPFDTTSSAGKMAIQMLGSCAEFERNRLVERVFPGMVVGVKRGHWQGARYAPYGYRYNKEIKKLEVIRQNLHVLEELGDMIKLNASEPEQLYVEQLEEKDALFKKNIEKQKGIYELFSEDKINLALYKDRAELLSNEEKKLKQDIKAIQLKILDKRNSSNLVKATQDFLLRLRSTPDNHQLDYLVKTFMRIIFKSIHIQNQEIVKFDLNETWKRLAMKRG